MEVVETDKVGTVEHGWRALVFGRGVCLFGLGEKDGENAASCLDLVRRTVHSALLVPADGTAAAVAAEEAGNLEQQETLSLRQKLVSVVEADASVKPRASSE